MGFPLGQVRRHRSQNRRRDQGRPSVQLAKQPADRAWRLHRVAGLEKQIGGKLWIPGNAVLLVRIRIDCNPGKASRPMAVARVPIDLRQLVQDNTGRDAEWELLPGQFQREFLRSLVSMFAEGIKHQGVESARLRPFRFRQVIEQLEGLLKHTKVQMTLYLIQYLRLAPSGARKRGFDDSGRVHRTGGGFKADPEMLDRFQKLEGGG